MFPKVPFTIMFTFIFGLHGKILVSSLKCYSCEASDKHLPMSDCYFITSATNTTVCSSSCLFFQYIVPEEYTHYDAGQKENTTVKGNIAYTVRSCAPANINDTCLVNSTAAVVRQCVICDTDLCNGSSKRSLPTILSILSIAVAFHRYMY